VNWDLGRCLAVRRGSTEPCGRFFSKALQKMSFVLLKLTAVFK